jgi:MFS family permease
LLSEDGTLSSRHSIFKTLLFQRLGLSDVKSRIVAACNGTEYFLISLVTIYIIDRVGRRPLMLFGAIGQSLTMVLLAILGSINNSASQIVSAVLLFVFNSFFAIGWLGMTWLYVCALLPDHGFFLPFIVFPR